MDGEKVGYGVEKTIKDAANLACLNLFKNLLPPGTTWNGAVKIIRENKDPLHV